MENFIVVFLYVSESKSWMFFWVGIESRVGKGNFLNISQNQLNLYSENFFLILFILKYSINNCKCPLLYFSFLSMKVFTRSLRCSYISLTAHTHFNERTMGS